MVALPDIGRDLGFSAQTLLAVVTAYAVVARVAVAAEALSPPPRPAIAPDNQSRKTGLVAARKLTSADETHLGYTIAIGACNHNAVASRSS